MGDGEVAAGRHGAHYRGHDRVRVIGVRQRVQDREHRDCYWLGEVEQSGGLGKDSVGVAEVGVDELGGAFLGAGEQCAGVGEDDRIVVDVGDPRLRCDGLGNLVSIARGGDAGPDVEELPDARVGGEVADGASEERPVGLGTKGYVRPDPDASAAARSAA